MRDTPSRLRQTIHHLEESLALHVRHLLAERRPLRRGSFVTLHRTCGKPTCHCTQGEKHPTAYLSTRQEGRTRLIYITAAHTETVAADAARYRQFRQHRAAVARVLPVLLQRIDALGEALETHAPLGGPPPRSPKGA